MCSCPCWGLGTASTVRGGKKKKDTAVKNMAFIFVEEHFCTCSML